MKGLTEIIIQRIENEGPISFHDFMEMALYYPGLGYYISPKEKVGRNGDYYTSCSLTPIFGAVIGRQLEEMWANMGKEPFTIVEYGAGGGALCHDILQHLENNPEFYDRLRYCIIEKRPPMREKSKAHPHEKVSWHDSLRGFSGITGCILSNELIDNFSVHQVVMEEELKEVFVDYQNGFTEVLRSASEELKNYFRELDIELPEGFRTEVNLQATAWMREVAQCLKKGYVLTIDYGFPSAELYSDHRSRGTIMCYNRHHINDHPYYAIGEQDITAHVNFTALYHWGIKNGLDYCGYTNQADFLLNLGLTEHLKKATDQEYGNFSKYKKEAFLKYTLLFDMGSKFKVLTQQKSLPKHELSGMKFSEPISARHPLAIAPAYSRPQL